MKLPFNVLSVAAAILTGCAATPEAGEEVLTMKVGGKELVNYQAAPMSNPVGGDAFRGSDFIHPLKTPSGFVITEIQPRDHLHHFGLWWPWKYVEVGGRKVLCWELQSGDGIIEAKESRLTEDGFTAASVYTDRKAQGGPATLINETVNVTASEIVNEPATGYFLDLEIVHEVAGNEPLTITKYRYSGFCLRGAAAWNRNNSSVMTSEGKSYNESNFTRARWVLIQGKTSADGASEGGVIMMSRPDNHNHPEKLRTWDPGTENGAIFVNFNPVQDESWVFEPGKKYTRNYRLLVYDGKVTSGQAEELWKEYAGTVE